METQINLIDEQTTATKNKEVIKVDIYEPDAVDIYEPDKEVIFKPVDELDYEYCIEEELARELKWQLEYVGILDWLLADNTKDESRLSIMSNSLIGSIGDLPYKLVIQLLSYENQRLKQAAIEAWQYYDSINS